MGESGAGGVVLQAEDHEGLGSVNEGTRNTDFGSGSSLIYTSSFILIKNKSAVTYHLIIGR